MIRRCVGFILAAMLLSVGVFADSNDDLTGWQKAQLVAFYPLAIHQLPLTTVHEGSHWLVARAFGDRPSIHLLPSYVENEDGSKMLTTAHIKQQEVPSPGRNSLILIAPYVVQLLLVDRTAEWAYGRGRIRIDSFGDKYAQNVMTFNMFFPLQSTFSKHGDFGQLAGHTHIHRFILGAAVQVAYIVSYTRIMRARGHKDSIWVLYFHRTF